MTRAGQRAICRRAGLALQLVGVWLATGRRLLLPSAFRLFALAPPHAVRSVMMISVMVTPKVAFVDHHDLAARDQAVIDVDIDRLSVYRILAEARMTGPPTEALPRNSVYGRWSNSWAISSAKPRAPKRHRLRDNCRRHGAFQRPGDRWSERMRQPHTAETLRYTDDQQNTGTHKKSDAPDAKGADRFGGTKAGRQNVERMTERKERRKSRAHAKHSIL
jgi:hypothetical protein